MYICLYICIALFVFCTFWHFKVKNHFLLAATFSGSLLWLAATYCWQLFTESTPRPIQSWSGNVRMCPLVKERIPTMACNDTIFQKRLITLFLVLWGLNVKAHIP